MLPVTLLSSTCVTVALLCIAESRPGSWLVSGPSLAFCRLNHTVGSSTPLLVLLIAPWSWSPSSRLSTPASSLPLAELELSLTNGRRCTTLSRLGESLALEALMYRAGTRQPAGTVRGCQISPGSPKRASPLRRFRAKPLQAWGGMLMCGASPAAPGQSGVSVGYNSSPPQGHS